MANHKSALRRVRNSKRKNTFHNQVKGQIRSLEKTLRSSVSKKDKEQSEKAFKSLVTYLDKAVSTAGYHKNKSARKKSRMAKLLQTTNS